MKLQLRFLERGAGAPCHILTDEDGFELPGQQEVAIRYAADALPFVTVTFRVDGEHVTITNLPVREIVPPAWVAVFAAGVFMPLAFA